MFGQTIRRTSQASALLAATLIAACGGTATPAATPATEPAATAPAAQSATATPAASPAAPVAAQPVAAAPAAAPLTPMQAALAGDWRKPEEKARDVYRHPSETLQFFGLKDTMTVIEMSPGQGWYTAVLAPLLRDKGKLVIAGGDPNGPPDSEGTKNAKGLLARLASRPDVFGKVESKVVKSKEAWDLGPANSADMVVTFRSFHGWAGNGLTDKALNSIHAVLKPGGVLGLVAHRAKPDAKTDAKSIQESGYAPEAYVIKTVEAHGFKLAEKSEVNANPKDTKDYPKGVWTLPPTYELGEKDHAKYEAIGESDRMTLRFVKK